MALRRARRDIFCAPLWVNREKRARVSTWAVGTRRCSKGRIVSAPRNIVSSNPARMQQAIGKDVTPLRIGTKLDFVNSKEFDLSGDRHAFDGAEEIFGPFGDDFFFARHQGDSSRAPTRATTRS